MAEEKTGDMITLSNIRSELRNMSNTERENLLPKEPVSFCLVGGKMCKYLFSYKGFPLCHYEVDRKVCVFQGSEVSSLVCDV